MALLKSTIGDESLETLGSKIRFSSVLDTLPRLSPNNVDFPISFNSLHRPQHLHNIELGGRGGGDYQRINARCK